MITNPFQDTQRSQEDGSQKNRVVPGIIATVTQVKPNTEESDMSVSVGSLSFSPFKFLQKAISFSCWNKGFTASTLPEGITFKRLGNYTREILNLLRSE